ncbi:MAG: TonB-dependent receptor [Pseudomonadota bacterium]
MNRRTRRLVSLALPSVLLGLLSPPVLSQNSSADNRAAPVYASGSRLTVNPDLASAVPVMTVSADEARLRGNLRVEDFLNTLPQVFADQASEVSNGATGIGTLNLRGLGPERTLVLVDGRRLPYGSSRSVAANVDLVPVQMLERVEILTGGASAVYGSDAIGGVVNFVTRRDFEGVEVGGQYGIAYADNDDDFLEGLLISNSVPVPGDEWDGDEASFYVMLGAGTGDGRGNVTLFASYEDREGISQQDRITSACALGETNNPLGSFGGLGCVGTANFRAFGGDNGFVFQEESGEIVPFTGDPSQLFNFGPFSFFQRPAERYNLFAKGHYGLTDKVEAFADFSYTNNVSDARISPTATFGSWDINCDNPFIQDTPGMQLTDLFGCTDQDIADGAIIRGVFASHRNVEGGPRNTRLENSAWRLVAGLRGSFADDIWGWEAFVQSSQARDSRLATNDFIVANVQQAFLATTDADGNVVCQDQSGGCVPYNIFQRGPNGESRVTQEALDFIEGVGVVNGSTGQTVVGAHLQAELGEYGWRLPTAEHGVATLVGLEYRKDELLASPDQLSRLPGSGFATDDDTLRPVEGKIEITEFFTELQVPLMSGKPAAEELTLAAQYRYSDYSADGVDASSSFDAEAFGASLSWRPITQLHVRGQYQRAVRAPNVIELYTGQRTGLSSLPVVPTNVGLPLFDPCATQDPVFSLAMCERTGVTLEQYGTITDAASGQVDVRTGGNPDLKPETADTATFGVMWQPHFIPGLRVSAEYFDITVDDVIAGGVPPETALYGCLETGDARFCDLINRGASGSLAAGTPGAGFLRTNANIAKLETSGVDLQVEYGVAFGAYSLSVDYSATFLDQLDTVAFPGDEALQCAGWFGRACGTPSPEYRHRALVTIATPWNVDFTGTWRHFGSVDNANEFDVLEPKLDSVNYVDLGADWRVADNFLIRGSILNLLQEDAPVFSGATVPLGNGNTYPTIYDTGTVFVTSFQWNWGRNRR